MNMIERAHTYLTAGLDAALDAYPSKAAQKRVLEDINRAYEYARDAYGDLYRVELFAGDDADRWVVQASGSYDTRRDFLDARDVPFDLHHVRERHIERFAEYSPELAVLVKTAIAARADVKATPVAAPVKTGVEIEEKKIVIQRSIREEMDRLGTMYREGLDIARLFKGLPVSANVHVVTNQYGTTFLRAFYYLAGKRMPLNTIMAVAGTIAEEKKGKA